MTDFPTWAEPGEAWKAWKEEREHPTQANGGYGRSLKTCDAAIAELIALAEAEHGRAEEHQTMREIAVSALQAEHERAEALAAMEPWRKALADAADVFRGRAEQAETANAELLKVVDAAIKDTKYFEAERDELERGIDHLLSLPRPGGGVMACYPPGGWDFEHDGYLTLRKRIPALEAERDEWEAIARLAVSDWYWKFRGSFNSDFDTDATYLADLRNRVRKGEK
jgi:hypothetical protein